MRKEMKLKTFATFAFLTIAFTSCSSESTTEADATAETEVASTEAVADASMTIEGAWARTSPMDATVGAAYMNITSSADDALVNAAVDSSVAMMTQVHETTMAADGSMGMQEIESLPLPAGVKTELKPGGYHIMIMKLVKPLVVGETISITLTFESGLTQVVEVPVLEEAP
jgi:copper(I)-binding protein